MPFITEEVDPFLLGTDEINVNLKGRFGFPNPVGVLKTVPRPLVAKTLTKGDN